MNYNIKCFLKKTSVLLILLSTLTLELRAQQDPLYTQYMFNTLPINPGYAGSREMLSLMILGRQQWVGFDGAPTTATFTIHSPIYAHMAAGATIIYDSYGPVNQTSFSINYAYHLKMSESTKLSLGLSGGFNHYAVDYNKLDRTFYVDDAYNYGIEQTLSPNFGFGLYMYSPKFYIGLSVPKIIENTYDESKEGLTGGVEFRHYYGMAGVALKMNEWLTLKPSILARVAQGSPLNIDANINTIIQNKIWLGIMHRLGESFGAIAQYQLSPQLRLGYAFDLNTNELSSHHSGSHEIMINFEFNFNKEQIINPRYF